MATATGPHRLAVREAPAYQAYLILRTGFVVAPILFGLDKFTNLLTDWTAYLAPARLATAFGRARPQASER